jgi:hypothetical protein
MHDIFGPMNGDTPGHKGPTSGSTVQRHAEAGVRR